jgi:hypothetical protein
MKKIVILLVILVTVFAITIPASARGNGSTVGPGDGTGPVGGLGPIAGNGSGENGSGVGPGDGTGPVGGLVPVGGNDSAGPDSGYGPLGSSGSAGSGSSYGPFGGNGYVGSGSGNGLAQQGTRGVFTMSGTIAAIGTSTVTIDVLHGNKLVQPYLGTQVIVTVTSLTRYLSKDGTTTTTIGLADLQVGQQVSAYGTVANNIWTISRITVGASLSCLP